MREEARAHPGFKPGTTTPGIWSESLVTTDTRVKLLMSYDILNDDEQAYYQYVLGEFLPKVQALGLIMTDAWHTAYGNYPARLISFVARDRAALNSILHLDEWKQLEERLQSFVAEYQIRVVPYRDRFQF